MAADSSQTSNGTVGKFSFYSGQQGYQSLAKSFTDLAHSRDRFGSSTGVNAFGKYLINKKIQFYCLQKYCISYFL